MIKEEEKQQQQQQHISSARDGLASRSAKTNSTAGRCVCVCVCELNFPQIDRAEYDPLSSSFLKPQRGCRSQLRSA